MDMTTCVNNLIEKYSFGTEQLNDHSEVCLPNCDRYSRFLFQQVITSG